ncbi:MAG: sigma-70 family RNA polymerase sigma factor [Ginsengibacter sp.]
MSQIESLKCSDDTVFKEVYAAYHHRVYNYILFKTQSDYLSEEVVQIAFIKLWNFRSSLSEEVTLPTQIFRIANTTLIDYLRSAQQKNKNVDLKEEALIPVGNNALPNLFLHETKLKLNQLITHLPPIRRKVFEMSRFQDMSHKEISEVLNIAPKTVENHIYLALKYIRPFFSLLLIAIITY